MTEITQADRDAAASGYFAWCSGNPVIPDRMKAGDADDHSMVQAFARHRMEATEALSAENERLRVMSLIIADWLRCAPMESGVCCCGDPIEEHGYDSGHSPVDAVQYSAMQLESEIRAALGDTE